VVIANGENAARNVSDLLLGDRILIDLAGVSREVPTTHPSVFKPE
jgi:hypothetical protein